MSSAETMWSFSGQQQLSVKHAAACLHLLRLLLLLLAHLLRLLLHLLRLLLLLLAHLLRLLLLQPDEHRGQIGGRVSACGGDSS